MIIAENSPDSELFKTYLQANSQDLEEIIAQGMVGDDQKNLDLSPGMEGVVIDYGQQQNDIMHQPFFQQNDLNQVYYQQDQQQQQQQQVLLNQLQNQPTAPFGVVEPPHLFTIPDLLPVQNNRYDFQVDVPPETTTLRYIYDQEQDKLFIKISSTIAFNASFIPSELNEQMYLRAMILFSEPENMHLPVSRCANHRKGNDDDKSKCNILKSVNPKAIYCGNENGLYFKDRLSILIPIEKRDEYGRNFENLGFTFECQSSCSSGINRRATAIVFTLESSVSGEMLGKKVIRFKVCSCPKRDADREKRERSEKGMKRKNGSNSEFPHGKRPMKTSLLAKKIKTEPDEPESSDETEQVQTDSVATTVLPSLTVAVVLVPEILKYIHDLHAGKLAEDKTAPVKPYTKMLNNIQKVRKQFQYPKNEE